jgi:hypothetical protein
MSKIVLEIYEPPASYTPPTNGGLVLVKCDCSCGEKCPQGNTGIAACFVWMQTDHISDEKKRTIYR